MGGPPDGRAASALGRDAPQDPTQGQRCPALVPPHTRAPEAIGELLPHDQDRNTRAPGRGEAAAEASALACEGTPQGVAPLRCPGRQIRTGPWANLGPVADGVAPEHGRRSVARGNGGEIQA